MRFRFESATVKKLGKVYFEVVHDNYSFRPKEKAAEHALKIAEIADLLSEQIKKQKDNQKTELNQSQKTRQRQNYHELFKILGFCDYPELSTSKIKNKISEFLDDISNIEQSKLTIAFEILSSLKFTSQNSSHPNFEQLKEVFEKIKKLDMADEPSIFNAITTTQGFSSRSFSTKSADEYDDNALKNIMQSKLEEIKAHLPADFTWDETYANSPKLFVQALLKATHSDPKKLEGIQAYFEDILSDIKNQTENKVKNYLAEKLKPSTDGKTPGIIKIESIEFVNILKILKNQFFSPLKIKNDLPELNKSLSLLDDADSNLKRNQVI